MTGMIFGTFDYMSPEQMTPGAPVTPLTDIYALGVMSYQMITGRVPKGAYTRPSRFTDAPVAVDALIDAAMSNDAELRPGKAGDFARKMSAIAGVKPKSKRVWIAGGALAAAAGAVVVAWTLRPEATVKPPVARSEPVPVAVAAAVVAPSPPVEVAMPASPEPGPAVAPVEMAPVEPEPALVVAPMGPPVVTAPAPAGKTPAAKPVEQVPWTWVLGEVRPAEHALRGTWSMRGKELVAGSDICVLRLPVHVAENYDVAVEFTRTGGRNSIGVFLPTRSGEGVFELDAWDRGIGGLQRINGEDMRDHGQYFPAKLTNGEKQKVVLQVRGSRVSVTWNGEPRMTWDLTGHRFDSTALWETGTGIGLGLCAWRSPTVFHRIAYRTMPAE
jgi:hypothetical protein